MGAREFGMEFGAGHTGDLRRDRAQRALVAAGLPGGEDQQRRSVYGVGQQFEDVAGETVIAVTY
ncbi:hypothetical protein O6P37_16525 [Mycobacterium sp. CPCC 205372]|uniref:Uncharacterized protein n=1 Tax=Mycobacterium hippophais TaxID=3016340 RepID=A0ABT4PVD6_9MYCO|nr:hypothetical protein [Mycobacterium hippophais]MCZ8380473.1 hypothetical protein [Mycobacterium hippophais]